MAQGPLVARVEGNPYAVAGTQFADTVLALMRRAMTWEANPQLTTDLQAAATPSTFTVLTFNSGVVDANAQCHGASVRGRDAQPEGAMQLAASFCGSGGLISNTNGSLGVTTGLDNPRFVTLIRQVAIDLLPPASFGRPGNIGL